MIEEAVHQFFVNHGIPPCRIVAAVSGGSDSTALLLALREQQEFEVVAAHVNHHLRGAESDADEQFVRELCASLNVELHVEDGTLDPGAVTARGLEAAAREVRYARLHAIRERTAARYIATAHQKNDQAETIVMRQLMGAVVRGIQPVRADGVIRPLLDVTRMEIEAYLGLRGVQPRHDASNDDMRFLRNRVRRMLDGDASAADLAEESARSQEAFERAVGSVRVETTADATRFLEWPEDEEVRQALLHRHIRRLDPDARPRRRTHMTGRVELVRRGEQLVLRRRFAPTPPFEAPLAPGQPASLDVVGVSIHLERRNPGETTAPRDGAQLFQLPTDASPTFTVRNRRPGDVFHPLGLGGSKKLKEFLIDRKIAASVRDRLPLLIWNHEIVWIAGVEISDRFKVQSPAGVLYEVWMEGSGGADE